MRSRHRLRTLLAGSFLFLSAPLAGCGSSGGGSDLAEGYASVAQTNLRAVADAHLESLRVSGRPLTYAETIDLAEPLGIRIVVGASRAENIVSIQLENASPGMLPFMAEDGGDCIVLLVRYPGGRSPFTEMSTSWVLVKNYVRNLEAIPSAVCAADAHSGMSWGNIPVSSDPSRPVVLD
jgi:hypothetical protein